MATCSLYKKIDILKVQCLNESVEGAGKSVFKPWEDRLDREKVSASWSLVVRGVILLIIGVTLKCWSVVQHCVSGIHCS